MDRAQHIMRCMAILGPPWSQVHDFLDQFFPQFGGEAHRIVLHHALGIELCVSRFGEAARAAANLHVKDDLGGVVPQGPQEVADGIEVWPDDLKTINRALAAFGWPEISLRRQRARERRAHRKMLSEACAKWMERDEDNPT